MLGTVNTTVVVVGSFVVVAHRLQVLLHCSKLMVVRQKSGSLPNLNLHNRDLSSQL